MRLVRSELDGPFSVQPDIVTGLWPHQTFRDNLLYEPWQAYMTNVRIRHRPTARFVSVDQSVRFSKTG